MDGYLVNDIQKILVNKEKRFLKIDEILKSGYGRFHRSKNLKSDIELINNTEEEIVDIIKRC